MTAPGGALYVPWVVFSVVGMVLLFGAVIAWLPAVWRVAVIRRRQADPAAWLWWLTVPRALALTVAGLAVLTLRWTSVVAPIAGLALVLLGLGWIVAWFRR